MVFRRRRLKRPISIAKSVYGYIRTKVTAGRHFRTDLSVQKSERVKHIILNQWSDYEIFLRTGVFFYGGSKFTER